VAPADGAVSATKRSIAAAIAAASGSEGAGTIAAILGRGGRRRPFLLMRASNHQDETTSEARL
jgi:hypothetical protein